MNHRLLNSKLWCFQERWQYGTQFTRRRHVEYVTILTPHVLYFNRSLTFYAVWISRFSHWCSWHRLVYDPALLGGLIPMFWDSVVSSCSLGILALEGDDRCVVLKSESLITQWCVIVHLKNGIPVCYTPLDHPDFGIEQHISDTQNI